MFNNDVVDDFTKPLYERIALVTKNNVRVNAYDYIASEHTGVPLNDLLVSTAHDTIGLANNMPADTKATLILEYKQGKLTYKRADGTVIGTSTFCDDGDDWHVIFKDTANNKQYIEANEYDTFVSQFI